ncbi:histone deacetylase family protein [Candidatus Fermentibacteria bacterium]|nr:histone deacetylase family protein [Candidatus Fermentibacteria bacterium]
MFLIRKIYDDVHPANRSALDQVRQILAEQFHLLTEEKIPPIPDLLRNPLKHQFRAIVYVAEDRRNTLSGFALLSHEPNLGFCFLDYLAAHPLGAGRGIGGALYERVREEAIILGACGIFFECLPDESAECADAAQIEQNRARLRFYERFGARPIINTAYETPVGPNDDCPPYLVFDDLGSGKPLPREYARHVVASVLRRKYRGVCSPTYVRMVVDSFRDDPVQLRKPRYRRVPTETMVCAAASARIALVVTDRHRIHHIKERGYVESPVRMQSILDALTPTGLFRPMPPKAFADRYLTAVHDAGYVRYFKRVCRAMPEGKSVYPYVFPLRNRARPPVELAVRAGYYCIDTFTPLNQHAYQAARRAVDCALTGAESLLAGTPAAYALVRPPGHHAERMAFGGFCYFNNAAIAAQHLSWFGTVAMLDIDYHHGNGQQMIFYERRDVLTVSIHARPRVAYPYFSGFVEERGEGAGKGFNINLPLPEQVDGARYGVALQSALAQIRRFSPTFLVVCVGFDTAKGDPTGTWALTSKDFGTVGARIGSLRLPTLFVQEGGYRTRGIGLNARHLFTGFARARFDTRANDERPNRVGD